MITICNGKNLLTFLDQLNFYQVKNETGSGKFHAQEFINTSNDFLAWLIER